MIRDNLEQMLLFPLGLFALKSFLYPQKKGLYLNISLGNREHGFFEILAAHFSLRLRKLHSSCYWHLCPLWEIKFILKSRLVKSRTRQICSGVMDYQKQEEEQKEIFTTSRRETSRTFQGKCPCWLLFPENRHNIGPLKSGCQRKNFSLKSFLKEVGGEEERVKKREREIEIVLTEFRSCSSRYDSEETCRERVYSKHQRSHP